MFEGIPGFEEYIPDVMQTRFDFDKFKTRWLLHHVDPVKGVMRAELSVPIKIGDSGETDQWESRIILEPIPFDQDFVVDPASGDLGGPELDVHVRKKA